MYAHPGFYVEPHRPLHNITLENTCKRTRPIVCIALAVIPVTNKRVATKIYRVYFPSAGVEGRVMKNPLSQRPLQIPAQHEKLDIPLEIPDQFQYGLSSVRRKKDLRDPIVTYPIVEYWTRGHAPLTDTRVHATRIQIVHGKRHEFLLIFVLDF